MSYKIDCEFLTKLSKPSNSDPEYQNLLDNISNIGPIMGVRDTWVLDTDMPIGDEDIYDRYGPTIAKEIAWRQQKEHIAGQNPTFIFELLPSGELIGRTSHPPVIGKGRLFETDFGMTIVYIGSGAEGEQAGCLPTETGSSPVASAIITCKHCGRRCEAIEITSFRGEPTCFLCSIGWFARAGMVSGMDPRTALTKIAGWVARVSPNSVDI